MSLSGLATSDVRLLGAGEMGERESVDEWFLSSSAASLASFWRAVEVATEAVVSHLVVRDAPFSGIGAGDLAGLVDALPLPGGEGVGIERAMDEVGAVFLRHAVDPSHPKCAAHLHCPPMITGVAAEIVMAAANQSMDSWDQAPSATMIEERLVAWLANLLGWRSLGEGGADGVFTSGGTLSNQMGVLLARERWAQEQGLEDPSESGWNNERAAMVVFVAESAHFSIEQAAALCGLGRQSVVRVATDGDRRMDVKDLVRCVDEVKRAGKKPGMVVATCGTTDFGSLDPLSEIADVAENVGMWMHVDAAYGAALLLCSKRRNRLAGLERAHSVALDFHKMFFQPISCGAFLVRDQSWLWPLGGEHEYLDRRRDRDRGMRNLVGKSLQTTRRFDALKLLLSLRAAGTETYAAMIDHLCELARTMAGMLSADERFELLSPEPSLSTVIFRCRPDRGDGDDELISELQDKVRLDLLQRGQAVVGLTRVDGRYALKLTLLNPRMGRATIVSLRDDLAKSAANIWKEGQ